MTRTSTLIAALFAATLTAPLASAATLTINIENIQDQQGTLRVGVFNEAGYNGDGAVSGANIVVDAETATATVEVEPGTYGIRLFHDVNDDETMNTNPFGMPTEPYAFSNDARGRFGPAKWEQVQFDVADGENTHTITMK